MIKNFKKKFEVNNLKIISSNGKLGEVRNKGILNANGKWIAFIDADEIADPYWLKELLKLTKKYDGVAGSIYNSHPNVNFITKSLDLLSKERIKFLKTKRIIKTIGTGNLIIDRKIFDNGLKFDNKFPTAEDGDFTYRVYKKGYKIGYNEKAIIYHHIPNTILKLYFYRKKSIIGKIMLFLKYRDYYMFLNILGELFYWISLSYIKVYKKNYVVSRIKFIMLGFSMFIMSIFCYLNPVTYIKSKNRYLRPK